MNMMLGKGDPGNDERGTLIMLPHLLPIVALLFQSNFFIINFNFKAINLVRHQNVKKSTEKLKS